MASNVEDMQKATRIQAEPIIKATEGMFKGTQRLAAEAADLAKRSLERNMSYFEKLNNTKSMDEIFRINMEYASSNVEHFFSGMTKMAECYASLSKDASEPIRDAVNTAQHNIAGTAQRVAAQQQSRAG